MRMPRILTSHWIGCYCGGGDRAWPAGRITVFEARGFLTATAARPSRTAAAGADGRVTAVGPRGRGRAAGRDARRSGRQDDHAGDGQRARAHRLRGLHHLAARAITRPANLLDHLQREAFYGVAATTSVGSSPTALSLQFQRDQQAGKFPPAARYLFMPGMAPPNGGPDHILREATNELHVVNEVTTPAEARAAVQRDGRPGHPPREDLGRRPGRHVSEAVARGLQGHRRRGARAQDDGARARHPAGRSEGGGARPAPTCSCTWCSASRSTTSSSPCCSEKKPYWATVIGAGRSGRGLQPRSVLRAGACRRR